MTPGRTAHEECVLRSPFARLTLRAYDPDLAKQYLRDAGFPNGTTITIDAQILTAPSRRLSPRATGCSPHDAATR